MKTVRILVVVFYVMVLGSLCWQISRSNKPWLAALAAGLVVVMGLQLFVNNRREKRENAQVADWQRRLDALVDVHDFNDDGHLSEYFDPAERERLIQELERMPPGARSLRQAINRVAPDIVDDGG